MDQEQLHLENHTPVQKPCRELLQKRSGIRKHIILANYQLFQMVMLTASSASWNWRSSLAFQSSDTVWTPPSFLLQTEYLHSLVSVYGHLIIAGFRVLTVYSML